MTLLLSCLVGWSDTEKKVSRVLLGIMPVYNSSGEPYAEELSRQLTLMLFEEVEHNGTLDLKLLNPGGVYTPADTDWIQEVGSKSLVDAVLVSTLLQSDRSGGSDATLRLQLELVELKKGQRSAPVIVVTKLNKRVLDTSVSSLMARRLSFKQEPLGKSAKKLVESAGPRIAELAKNVVCLQTPTLKVAPASAVNCTIEFHVLYATKNSASKSYTLIANRLDQSTQVDDGVVHLSLVPGPLVIQAEVKDAPFRLPVQSLYDANEYVDCASHKLSLIIGAAGEASLAWK